MSANDKDNEACGAFCRICAIVLGTVGAWILVAGMACAGWWLTDFILNTLPK